MFWKKKEPQAPEEPVPATVPEAPMTQADILRESAVSLAAALKQYSDAARKAARPDEDPELKNAYETVAATEKLVKESRLAYALGRCLPEHVKYWPSWSKRDDFEKHVGFDAEDIEASSSEEQGAYRNVNVSTVSFNFKGTRYQLNLRDDGMSSAPGDPFRFGEIEVVAEGKRVARFGLIEDISSEFSTWTFSDVRTLLVGPWMQHVLDMTAQIEASDERRRNEFLDERVRAAAREIDLG
ncbi:hypothetical protein GQE99_20575 [Maritimibacter sp. DP07]|uniref:Uncharacterized protein n=1 Tax=Maritimibacter harenae TaxID=2606218 RepID=A0A845M5U7_9RHOB|nr:hypothetical protein [Maritimibacter harenae]MZR15415.1 hypothetical protein [Maritimibacter harenae]